MSQNPAKRQAPAQQPSGAGAPDCFDRRHSRTVRSVEHPAGQGKRVVVAAAGTAGHVGPAVAVAQVLRALGAAVDFIGADRAEAQLVPAAGFALHQIAVEGLNRRNPLLAARSLGRALSAVLSARSILRQLRPDVLFGAGGYIVAPVGLAALSLRIPIVLSEADSHLGLANRLLAGRARAVCLAFPIPGRTDDRYQLTGRALPAAGGERSKARARFGIPDQRACVLVFGGSLGARSINQAALAGLPGSNWHVLHICGSREYEQCRAVAPESTDYDLREYLPAEEFAWALSAADLVVARAGSSVLELAAHALPMILVPYPQAAADHQRKNALYMRDAGAAVVIDDDRLDGAVLAEQVGRLLAEPKLLQQMAQAAAGLAGADAAERIADLILAESP